MNKTTLSRVVSGTGLMLAIAGVGLAAGCEQHVRVPTPPPRMSRGPVQPTPEQVTGPLPEMTTEVDHSPLLLQALPAPGLVVDARVLVISADGSDTGLPAIQQALRYLGTPFDVLIASTAPTLTASQLGTSTHGKYNAVVLTTGNLALSGGSSAFSNAEFQTLATYEATFKVRRAALYTAPDTGYGYSGSVTQNTVTTPLQTQCTTAGRAVFPSVNCNNGVLISGAFAYRATALDSATIPLLTDSSGRILSATRAYVDGREALTLNFAQSQSLFHTLQLFHGVVSWVTRGVFLGERHGYLGVQVDDLFLPDDIYTGGTFRMTPSDLQATLDYQTAKRGQATTAGMRFNFAFNGGGTVDFAPDALAAKAQQIGGSSFNYISHTYDHTELDPLSYAQVLNELTSNNAIADQYGLRPFSPMNLVTPSITGLASANAMRAMFDAGVRYVVSDSSIPGQDNPSPNAGIFNSLQPQILEIPRRPTNLFYNVSTPAQWMAEYNDIYRSFWGRDLSYDEILDHESDVLTQYLLKGETDPWMFHQPDLRIYGSGRSILGDLLDRTFTKYSNYVTVPLTGPTMDDLGRRMADRMRYNASGASGTVDPNANNITVRVTSAATVPVTGACGGTNELYAGQRISYLALPAGGSVTIPLSSGSCTGSGGGGGGGTGGAGGTGGTGGTGGMSGAGGASGTGGMTGTGGMSGTGGATGMGGATGAAFSLPCTVLNVNAGQIGPGQTASALTTAELTGTTDVWLDYVELFPSSTIVCRYTLPASIPAASVTSLALQVNYRGPTKNTMTWTFEVLNATSGTWLSLGDNTFAPDWVWTPHTFPVATPLARFFSSGTLQIRYGTTSDVDASDIDQLLITGTH